VTTAYLSRYPSERGSLSLLFTALDTSDDPTSRKTFPTHVTYSAILIDGDRNVLHILHKASGKLLAPGGHNESDDRQLRDAALRELHAETGIPPSAVTPLPSFEDVPLDIDVHPIGASPSKDEPNHHHVDLRWGFLLRSEHTVTLQDDKVDGYEWRPFTSAASRTLRSKLALLP
jgi:8-oxo-dGTP pyrophosphatase MutT (NUDIX family)